MIETSVVGSYPVKLSQQAIIRAYEEGKDCFIEAIREAVEDQLSAGIDIVSSGQVRTDMISEFTGKISGIVCRGGENYILSRVGFYKPITLDDLVLTRNLTPKIKKIKAPLTGAFTLARSCKITEDSGYSGIEELAFDFAKVLNKEARVIEPHVDFLQIDEPFFSQELPEYAGRLIAEVRRGIKKPVALHVCGDVSGIFEKLAEYDVDILDHEFTSNPMLLDQIARTGFKQKIGYGCVKSNSPEIESVDEIAKSIERAIIIIGEGRIILDPDCGMRHLPREAAYKKLANMVDARNKVYGIETTQARSDSLGKKDWDTRGYFYILLDNRRGEIRVEHYNYDHVLNRVIRGKKAEAIMHTVLNSGLVSEGKNGVRHYGYLGTELQKAELALYNGLHYFQDRKLSLTSKI